MIVTLISKKGGVGKTTTAVNLAAALARRQQRVLLVDLDSQASASLSLGLGRGEMTPSVADVLLRDVAVVEAVHPTTTPGLDLLPASADLLSAELELSPLRHRERRLADRLAPIAGAYDFTFIDCPPSLSLLPINALVAADGFIVPVVPQFLAVEGVANLLDACRRLARRTGRASRLLGLALTMVDYRVRITREQVDALRQRFGNRVFAVEIRINVRLAEAPAAGLSIFDYDSHATGALAYEMLAEELLLRCRPRANVGGDLVTSP